MSMLAGLLGGELRLLVRNPFFLLIALLSHGLLLLTARGVQTSIDAAQVVYDGLGPILLLVVLLAAAVARRDKAGRSRELFLAAPHREWQPVLARFLAVWLGVLTITFTVAVQVAVRQALAGVAPFELAPWLWALGRLVLASSQVVAAGTALGLAVGPWWLIAPLAFGYWIVVSGVPAMEFGRVGYVWMFHLFDLAGVSVTVHPDLGGGPDGSLFRGVVLVGAGLALALLALSSHIARRHSRPFRAGVAAVLVIGLVAAGGGTLTFAAAWADRVSYRDAAVADAVDAVGCCADWPAAVPSVAAYDLDVTVAPATGELAVAARLTVTSAGAPDSRQLVLTLARSLELTDVRAEGAAVVAWQRKGSHLLVEIDRPVSPAAPVDVLLAYAGSGNVFIKPNVHSPMTARSYVLPGGTYLPGAIAWYPLPGRHTLEQLTYHPMTPLGPTPNQWSVYPPGFPAELREGVPVLSGANPDPGEAVLFTVRVNWDGPGRAVATVPLVAESLRAPGSKRASEAIFHGTGRLVTLAIGNYITTQAMMGGRAGPTYHVAPRYEQLIAGHQAFVASRAAFYNDLLPVVDPARLQVIGVPVGQAASDGYSGIVIGSDYGWQQTARFASLADADPLAPNAGWLGGASLYTAERDLLRFWWPWHADAFSSALPSPDGDVSDWRDVVAGLHDYMWSSFRRHHLGDDVFASEWAIRRDIDADKASDDPLFLVRHRRDLETIGGLSADTNAVWLVAADVEAAAGRDGLKALLQMAHARLTAGETVTIDELRAMAALVTGAAP